MEEHVTPAFGVVLAVLILGPSTDAANTATLTGMWRSAVDETPLSSEFDGV